MRVSRPRRALVAGAGVAGLETALALQALAGDRLEIELLAPDRNFIHRPLTLAAPIDGGSPRRIPLAAIAGDRGLRLHRDALARVLPGERAVETQGGGRLHYDSLVLAIGARPVEAVRGALTFRGPQDAGRVAAIAGELRAGTLRRLAFVVPPAATWTLPLYELALQTAAALQGGARHARLTYVTPEPAPLAAFGVAASAAARAAMAERGIEVRAGAAAGDYADGRLGLGVHGSLAADRVIALPRLLGPRPRGVPSDPLGFVPVDEFTRVIGIDGVHAVGDAAANGLEQVGCAAQQADVAASVIAAAAGVAIALHPFRPARPGLLSAGGAVRTEIAGRHLAPYVASHGHPTRPTQPAAETVEPAVAPR